MYVISEHTLHKKVAHHERLDPFFLKNSMNICITST